jgi:hypothetical protein
MAELPDPAVQPPSLADKLRAYAAQTYAQATAAPDPKEWQDAVEKGHRLTHAIFGYIPEPGIRDQLTDSYDLGIDTLGSLTDRQKMDAQLASIKNGVQQTATGFNEGLASTVGRALDAPGYFLGKAMGVDVPEEARHPFEGTFRKYFVDPAGPPTTPKQRILRAGGNIVGENIPTMVAGGGLAAGGIRTGVTLARQAADGLVDTIAAPAATAAVAPAAVSADAPAVGGLAGTLQKLAVNRFGQYRDAVSNATSVLNPANLANGMNPVNVVNSVRPANLQGATDATLDFIAQNPRKAATGAVYKFFRQGERAERARQAQQAPQPPVQPDPNAIATGPLDYNYGQF